MKWVIEITNKKKTGPSGALAFISACLHKNN